MKSPRSMMRVPKLYRASLLFHYLHVQGDRQIQIRQCQLLCHVIAHFALFVWLNKNSGRLSSKLSDFEQVQSPVRAHHMTGRVLSHEASGCVTYTVLNADVDCIWQWQFQIGDQSKSGTSETRIEPLAVRRTQMLIDRALEIVSKIAH
jgi:hypothetical protein